MKREENIWICIVGSSLLLLLASCSRKPSDANAGKSARPGAGAAVPVLVAKAATQNVPVEIEAVGTVQAYSVVSLRSQITGKISQVHFKEGQEVKAGDLLFTIDARPFEAALNQAQANLKRDEAQMINAQLNFQRESNLFVSKIASQSDYDTAAATFESAQSTVMADAAAMTNAQVNLSYTAIRAPIDGRTGNLAVKEGNVVKAPDDVLTTMTQTHPIYVAFAVPERQLPVIRRRASESSLQVKVFPPSEPNDIAFGELTFIDNSVDTNTGTILLKGTFANTNNALWPGQFVQTSLTLNTLTQAIVVPSQAVQIGQNGEYVFVVKSDSTVEARTNIATSITYDGVTVITKGLNLGETVVTDGHLKLTPGTKVNVKMENVPGPSTNTASPIE